MTLRERVSLLCKLTTAIPFLAFMLAGLFLAGANLVILFVR